MIALVAVAWADPCADSGPMHDGPVAVGVRPGELGRGRRVCARSELAVGGSASLLADAPAFYGYLVGTGDLDGSWAVDDRTELFARAELVRVDSVLAPLPDGRMGPGWFSVGASRRLATGERGAVGLNGKLLVPAHYANAFPLGVDLGVAGVWDANDWLRAHGQLSTAYEANVGRGPTAGRFGVAPTAGVALRPGRAFAFALDLVASFGLTAPLDHLAVAPGFRFAAGERFGAELGLALPLLGRERALAFVDLRASWRW